MYSTCCPIRCFREFSFRCNATPLYGLAVDVQALIITIRCRTEADCEVACTCESKIIILHEIFATLEAPWIGVGIKNALKTITVPFSFQFPIFVPIFDTIATLVIFVFMCEHPVTPFQRSNGADYGEVVPHNFHFLFHFVFSTVPADALFYSLRTKTTTTDDTLIFFGVFATFKNTGPSSRVNTTENMNRS